MANANSCVNLVVQGLRQNTGKFLDLGPTGHSEILSPFLSFAMHPRRPRNLGYSYVSDSAKHHFVTLKDQGDFSLPCKNSQMPMLAKGLNSCLYILIYLIQLQQIHRRHHYSCDKK